MKLQKVIKFLLTIFLQFHGCLAMELKEEIHLLSHQHQTPEIQFLNYFYKKLKGKYQEQILLLCKQHEAPNTAQDPDFIRFLALSYSIGNKALYISPNNEKAITYLLYCLRHLPHTLCPLNFYKMARQNLWNYFISPSHISIFKIFSSATDFEKFILIRKKKLKMPAIIFDNSLARLHDKYIALFKNCPPDNEPFVQKIITLESKILKIIKKIKQGMDINSGIFYITWLTPHHHIYKIIKNNQTTFPLTENIESLLFYPPNLDDKLREIQVLPHLLQEQYHSIEQINQRSFLSDSQGFSPYIEHLNCLNYHLLSIEKMIPTIIKFLKETDEWRNNLFFTKYKFLIPDY